MNNHKYYLNEPLGGIEFKKELIRLGILGIKFGQYLQTRNDLVSEEVRNVLESLFNENYIHSLDETLNILKKHNVYDKFDHIDEIIGSGSIAQTYSVRLNGYTGKYVLKILHPHVIYLDSDIFILKFIIKMINKYNGKLLNINWESFFEYICHQQNLCQEYQNLVRFREIYKDFPTIEIPEPFFYSKDFLVMSFCEGVSLNKIKDHDILENVSKIVTASFLHTTLKYYFAHGDLHPVNILVKKKGIALIDFGLCLDAKKDISDHFVHFYKSLADPTNKEYAYLLVSGIIDERNIHNQLVDYNEITIEWIEYNKKETPKDIFDTDTTKSLNLFINFLREKELVSNGLIINFLLQFNILNSYTPNNIIKSLHYMKRNWFFVNELGYNINEMFDAQVKITHPSISKMFED